MLSHAIRILYVIAIGGFAGAAPIPPGAQLTKSEQELKKLEGRWKIETVTHGGTDLMVEGEMEFKKDLLISNIHGEPRMYNRLTLDVSKDPHRLTGVEIEEPTGGVDAPKAANPKCRLLYVLKGDTLTFYAQPGNPEVFPETIEPKAGPKMMIIVLKKRKKD